MNKTIHTEFGKIEYVLQRKKMKNMRLKVDRGRIVVSCAKTAQLKHIENFVAKHAQWIMETQQKIKQKNNGILPEKFITGEAFHFLGTDYKLAVVPDTKDKAYLSGGHLILSVKEDTPEKKKALFLKWTAMQAKAVMEERFTSLYPQFERQVPRKPLLVFRKMKSRWGSANVNKHIITLNTVLVMAPVSCIDYVIVHELAHFIHPNHSKDFYGVVAEHIPDWKQRRIYLNKQYSLDF